MLLQDIAALTLARDLRDLLLAEPSGACSPRPPGAGRAQAEGTLLGRRLGILIPGAVVVTSLTAATVAAVPTPTGAPAVGPTRLGADPDSGAGTPPPGSCWSSGRFKPVAIPRGLEDVAPQGISPLDINNRGQIVGIAGTPTRPRRSGRSRSRSQRVAVA